MTSTPTYITRAAQGLLRDLRAQGHHPKSIDDAISRGLLTDLDWCAALDAWRPGPDASPPATPPVMQATHGVSLDDLLAVIRAHPGLTIPELAARVQKDVANMHRSIRRLESAHLITREGRYAARLYPTEAA